MPTQHIRLWAANASVGVGQWVAKNMAIWQEKGGLTIQQKDNEVRKDV